MCTHDAGEGGGRRARLQLPRPPFGPPHTPAAARPPPLNLTTALSLPTNTAQVLAAASKALSLSNPSTGSTISAPDAAASAFGSVTSFAQKTVESAGQAAPMPDSFKAAAAQSGAWAAVEQTRANAAAAAQKSANAAKDAAAAP